MDVRRPWNRTKRTPIGLDVGSRLIKAVQLEPAPAGSGARGMRVAAAVVVPRAVLMPPEPRRVANDVPGADRAKPLGSGSSVPSAQELAGLPEVLERAGFSGRRVVLAAPSGGLMTSVLELPARAGAAPARQIARMELARAHRCTPDAFEMGYWDLPPTGAGITMGSARALTRGSSIMAVGLPHTQANALLDAFGAAGLYVSAIDVGPCALARACEPLLTGGAAAVAAAAAAAGESARGAAEARDKAEESGPRPPPRMMAILDLGWDTSMLWLLYNGAIIYGRPLADGGLGRLHEALVTKHGLEADVADYLLTEVGLSAAPHADAEAAADAAQAEADAAADATADATAGAANSAHSRRRVDRSSLPDDEARMLFMNYAEELVRELSVSFAYAAHEYHEGDVGRLLMVGGGAAMPALAERLTSALGVAATPVTPADVAGCEPHMLSACASPALTAAAGLALFSEAA